MHGKEITIPKGTEITVYINGDMQLDPAKFGAEPVAENPSTPAMPSPGAAGQADAGASDELATVVIKSTPEGADITVDGKYVGNAPSSLRLTPGDHMVIVEKSGYRAWQRTINLSPGGIITIDAALEKL
jgi:PEGA domain